MYSFEPMLTQSGTEEITNDMPVMIWYHLAADINRHVAQFDFDYKWKSSWSYCFLKLSKGLMSTNLSFLNFAYNFEKFTIIVAYNTFSLVFKT